MKAVTKELWFALAFTERDTVRPVPDCAAFSSNLSADHGAGVLQPMALLMKSSHSLARFRELHLIAGNTSFQYKRHAIDT